MSLLCLGTLWLLLAAVGCGSTTAATRLGERPRLAAGDTVKVATVHFAPVLGDVSGNRQQLVQLTTEAAQNGAKIVVHTEMATSGYSYFSRQEISGVAETVPGPTTEALGEVARSFAIYVAVGMPILDPQTHLYFNSAVLIGPDGEVAGVYHKRNNLLEASYNAEEFAPVPTFETPYGRLGIVICADLFYSQFPRLAAVAGAEILLAPANVGVTTDFLQVRAFENDFSIIVANRYGEGTAGSKPEKFTQESFTIPSPFPYNFNYDSRSVVMTNTGEVLADVSAHQNTIGYGELPIQASRAFPVVRRPDLYPLLGQDTLEPYTFSQFGLPEPAVFAAAAVDPGAGNDPWQAALTAAQKALSEAAAQGYTLKLIVYPEDFFQTPDPDGIQSLQGFSTQNAVDLVLNFGASVPPMSLLLTPSADTMTYYRTHRGRDEPIPPDKLANDFRIIDRDYARLALLQDKDLFAPETSVVMAKMGVDVIAVNADSAAPVLSAMWKSRTGDYLHLVVANKEGKEGIYLGGYKANPSYKEADAMVVMEMNTQDVRNKKEPRFLDFIPLLEPCGENNC